MTRNAPEPDSRGADSPPAPPADDVRPGADAERFDDADYQEAELEDLEDDAERERQKARSALVGLVALIIVVVLAGIGVWASFGNISAPPPNPGVSRELPPAPAP